MNILFLSELFYPHGGGAELATYLYAKLLAEAKVNVVVITNRFSGEPDYSDNEGFRVYRLPLFRRAENVKYAILKRSGILFSSFLRKLIRWADVVYVPRFWFSAIPVTKAMGKPVITHLHDYIAVCPLAVLYDSKADGVCEKNGNCSAKCIYAYETCRRKGFVRAFGSTFLNLTLWPILRQFIEQSDALICVSKTQRKLIAKYAPQLKSKIKVIYNPLPNLPLTPLHGNDFGYFGGASYLKGFHILLGALEYRKIKGYENVTVHATKFNKNDKKLSDIAYTAGMILYGKLGRVEMEKIYQKIKAVIVPSICIETFNYVVAEALLKGRIVIASNIGGILELVEGSPGIFLFDAGDTVQLAEKIQFVNCLDVDEALKLGMLNRKTFTEKFRDEMSIGNFLSLCENIM
ncbi:MAG: glycosyltransferase family 4 protein [Nitrososphaeria archaeon]